MADYIIIGGGTAGSVAAARLSEDGKASVLLLEEGPRDRAIEIHLPVMVYKTATGNLLKRYPQEPTPGVHQDRKLEMVQARVLGGGSSVNAMLYVRGLPSDYDRWAADGADGWAWADVLPHFVKSEDNCSLAGSAHGVGGPQHVSYPEQVSPLTRIWLQAAQQYGLPYVADFNGGTQAGCGLYQMTLRNGRRASTATGYLKPARGRPNLEVRTGCTVTRIVIEDGRAVGLEYLRGGERVVERAAREVILSAGAIASPRLLMLSGIGPAAHLQGHGVEVRHDLPGVGQNLQDHMDCYLIYELDRALGYDKYRKLHWKAWAGLQYALFRSGPVASNVIEAGGFWSANSDDPHPDIQFAFLAGSGVEEGVRPVESGNGCTLNVCQTRPRSRGEVRLRSNRQEDAPIVAPNYLSDPYDLETMARGVRMGQEIMRQPAMQAVIRGEQFPGPGATSDEDFRSYVRSMAQGAIHPVGTCRIGRDRMAVVDPELRVHGIGGLRVADASILPGLPSGNTNAPSIMVGERVAAFVRRGWN
jgi:choline dehydrogenase